MSRSLHDHVCTTVCAGRSVAAEYETPGKSHAFLAELYLEMDAAGYHDLVSSHAIMTVVFGDVMAMSCYCRCQSLRPLRAVNSLPNGLWSMLLRRAPRQPHSTLLRCMLKKRVGLGMISHGFSTLVVASQLR